MRANAKILLILYLLLLVGIASAADNSVISQTSKVWLIANGADTSTVNVTVQNGTPVAGAIVTFSVDNPDFGIMNPATVITGSDGLAISTFKAGKKSGTATISAIVSYKDAFDTINAPLSVSQKIDHDIFWIFPPSFMPPADAAVNDTVVLNNVLITDKWGNPIDSARVTDIVSLSLSCPDPNDCEFLDPNTGNLTGHSLDLQPDPEGYLDISLKLGTKCGANTLVMSPTHNLNQQMLIIDTKAADLTLTGQISPDSLSVPAGFGKFFFNYTLTDEFGNPGEGQPIQIQTSLGETMVVYTDVMGKTPDLIYGPKAEISTITITATAPNSPVTPVEYVVNFVAPMPPNMIISDTPYNMASLDKDPASFVWVTVYVHDEFGAPKSGQNINFAVSYTSTGNDDLSHPPHLDSETAITGTDGSASVKFIPGAFNNPGPLTATATVTATWTDPTPVITQTGTYTWSNRPFLNINANVNPKTVINGSEMDVTINVTVSGQQPSAPLTIMLDEDCSGNMFAGGSKSRINDANKSMQKFIDKMDPTTVQIGLETFALSASPYPTPYNEVTQNFPALKSNLSNLTTLSGSNSQDMLPSIMRSIQELNSHAIDSHADDLKVLIFLSDGNKQLLTQGQMDALNATMQANNIYAFPITYNQNPVSGQAIVQMNALAQGSKLGSKGKLYTAKNAVELDLVFEQIYDLVMQLANEKTQMTLVFQDIEVDDQTYAGNDLYDYIPVDIPTGLEPGTLSVPSSTIISSARTSIIWPNKTQSIVNQSEEWESNTLNFHVGSIGLNQVWETTFRLKVNKVGCYNVFGSESKIELAKEVRYLSDLTVCVFEDPQNKQFQYGTLVVDTNPVASGGTDFKTLNWITTYASPSPSTNTAAVTVSYRVAGSDSWKAFYTTTANIGENDQSTTIDVRNFPRGKTIEIQVHATAPDAASADDYIYFTVDEPYNPYYINLK